jgi:hypothetical protein
MASASLMSMLFNEGVGVGAAQQLEVAGVGGHAVLHEGPFAPRERGGVHLLPVLAHMAQVGPELRRGRFGVGGILEALAGYAGGVVELLVAGAAAEGAREGVLHLCRG